MAKKKSRPKRKAAKKYYVLKVGKKSAIFTGMQPRQAALKAATRGYKEIKLRERGRKNKDGTFTVHVFNGSRKQVNAPANAPEWLPSRVWKPVVKKVGVDRVKKI
jgi:hypothetical protein